MCKLFVLDRNTWNHITVQKKKNNKKKTKKKQQNKKKLHKNANMNIQWMQFPNLLR